MSNSEAYRDILEVATAMADQESEDGVRDPTPEEQKLILARLNPGNVSAIVNSVHILSIIIPAEYEGEMELIRPRTSGVLQLLAFSAQVLLADMNRARDEVYAEQAADGVEATLGMSNGE